MYFTTRRLIIIFSLIREWDNAKFGLIFSWLSPCGHLAITDTLPQWTGANP